jgi:hypothetical protein
MHHSCFICSIKHFTLIIAGASHYPKRADRGNESGIRGHNGKSEFILYKLKTNKLHHFHCPKCLKWKFSVALGQWAAPTRLRFETRMHWCRD